MQWRKLNTMKEPHTKLVLVCATTMQQAVVNNANLNRHVIAPYLQASFFSGRCFLLSLLQ